MTGQDEAARPATRLLLTPAPLPTESLPGYGLYLAQVNGYERGNAILGQLKPRRFQGSTGRLQSDPLIELAGLSEAQLARLSMRGDTADVKATTVLAGQRVNRHHLRIDHPKVCPRCLVESGRCEAFWDLSLATACPAHGVPLLGACSECGERLRWNRRGVSTCECGADLRRQGESESVPPETRGLMRALREKLYDLPAEESTPIASPLTVLSFGALLSLVGRLCHEIARLEGVESFRARHRVAGHVDEAAMALAEWPTNFQRFLQRRYGPLLEGSGPLPVFRNLFGWASETPGKAMTNDRVTCEALRLQVFLFGAQFWSANTMTKATESFPVELSQRRFGSLGEATQLSGMHANTLGQYLSEGRVPTRIVMTTRGSPKQIIDLDWARSMSNLNSAAIQARPAAKRIGVTVAMLKELRMRGIYQVAHRGDGKRGVFTVADLDRLKARLADRFLPLDAAPSKRLPLGPMLQSSRIPVQRKVDFLSAVLAGRAKLFNVQGGTLMTAQISAVTARKHLATYEDDASAERRRSPKGTAAEA